MKLFTAVMCEFMLFNLFMHKRWLNKLQYSTKSGVNPECISFANNFQTNENNAHKKNSWKI